MNAKERTTVLVFGGEDCPNFFRSDILKIKSEGGLLVAVDSGADKILKMNLLPDVLLGDLDSLSEDTQKKLSGVRTVRFPAKKEMSDGELAILFAKESGFKEIIILAYKGGRTDHFLQNIHLFGLSDILKVTITFVAETESLYLLSNKKLKLKLDVMTGDTISLLPVSDFVTGVATVGLSYPLSDETLFRYSSRGISNVAAQQAITVSITDGMLIIVHNKGEVYHAI